MDKNTCTMGTTMALLHLDNDNASVYNIGDSRVYLIRDGRLLQITYDHVNMSIHDYNNNMENKHFNNNMLVKYLGMKDEKELKPYYKENIPVQAGDVFMACSDGLYNMLSEDEIIQKIGKLKKEPSCVITKELVGDALLAGGKDNITCIIIKTVEFE